MLFEYDPTEVANRKFLEVVLCPTTRWQGMNPAPGKTEEPHES